MIKPKAILRFRLNNIWLKLLNELQTRLTYIQTRAGCGINLRSLFTPRVKHICHPLLEERVEAYVGDDVASTAPGLFGILRQASSITPLPPRLLRTSVLARLKSY
jgi:hypothetical protein